MNIQEMVDTVCLHLMTQMKKSIVDTSDLGTDFYASNEICAYRGKDDCKCAAGCLIPDDLYSPAMEGKNVKGISFFRDLGEESERSYFLSLLGKLQLIHDSYHPEDWKRELWITIEGERYHNVTLPSCLM